MILLIRDNEGFEPRVKRYLEYYQKYDIDFKYVGWNRNGSAALSPHSVFFQKQALYGRRIANIPVKILWMIFVMKEIFRVRKECEVIHACDVDAALPALIMGKMLGLRIVFDVFDWLGSVDGKGVIYGIVEHFQNMCYRRSDFVILCEEERRAQAKVSNKNISVLPNIPHADNQIDDRTFNEISELKAGYDVVISYVGVFDRDRGLENLLECVSMAPKCLLNIAGFGVLDSLVQDYANKYENINCWGRVDYKVGQAIMKNSDYISAMYHLSSPLHKFAAPNKFYESLMLGVPIITTQNTLVGSKTVDSETGLVISECVEDLMPIVHGEIAAEFQVEMRERCRCLWEGQYRDYPMRFFEDVYLDKILGKKSGR